VRFEGPQPWSHRVPPTRAGVQAMLARLALVECAVLQGGRGALRQLLERAFESGALVVHACPSLADEGRSLQRSTRGAAYVVAAPPRSRAGGRS
jgi:hypothetical protein